MNNIPLPNLSLAKKLLASLVLGLALVAYLGSWLQVIHVVYLSGHESAHESFLGVALGVLASENAMQFNQLFWLHTASMVLLIGATHVLYHLTSLRRRVKALIFWSAIVLAGLDLSSWLYAPECSSSNLYVGIIGVIAAIPLTLLALIPLYQMWVYRRWQSPPAAPVRVAIVGGGFAGLYAALGLNRALGYHPKLEITVIDRRNYFLFPPLLPSAAAGTIETRQVTYPFRRIFETTNIRFRKVDVSRIDPKTQTISGLVEAHRDPHSGQAVTRSIELSYDYLVLAPGSLTQTFGTKGALEYAYFMRELNDAVVLRNHVIDCFEQAATVDATAERAALLRFVIVGAGPTGVETATEIHDLIHAVLLKRYPEIDPALPEVYLVQSGDQILPGWDPSIIKTTHNQLTRMGIKLFLGPRVSAVGPTWVKIGDGEQIATRTVVWAAGVKPSTLLARTDLPLHASGRVEVGPDLRISTFENVFVLGDAAHLVDGRSGKPLPPLGQVAFQQGSHTAKNLVRLLLHRPTRPFRYFDFGGLVSVGEHFAAVNLLGVKLSGFIGWFIWRSLYLTKLVGVSNKVRVVVDWTLDLLIERSIAQIRDSSLPAEEFVQVADRSS